MSPVVSLLYGEMLVAARRMLIYPSQHTATELDQRTWAFLAGTRSRRRRKKYADLRMFARRLRRLAVNIYFGRESTP
jgi:hypothetical protein